MTTAQAPGPRIYLDHAATTPLDPAVFEAMRPYLWEQFGNPSSLHGVGRRARRALDEARALIAGALAAKPDELVFCATGTESLNLAILGCARAARSRGRHLVVSAIEHHAVLHAARALRNEGFAVTEVGVDHHGLVHPDALRAALQPDTVLVSVGLANNEIGVVQDVAELARLAHEAGAAFHTDAVQAAGQLDINVDRLGVDLLSLAAHKFYGPVGAALLYARKGVELARLSFGGPQEHDRRAGTENVPGIVGMAAALVRAEHAREARTAHCTALRDALIQGVLSGVPGAMLTGHPTRRLPSIASFAFRDIEGESLLINLDLEGIEVSTGAACAVGSVEPSHVIQALGLPARYVAGALRCSVGLANTAVEMARVAPAIARHVAKLMDLASARHGAQPGSAP
ncbi:MAG: cysteine desulfurase [Actinobacteria bacterium]|nr:cysteine desulfurase [Actinomycetota bacterium]